MTNVPRVMITSVDDYFANGCGRCDRFATDDCSARRWRDALAALRTICRGAGLEETAKWGHPCYVHAGRNIAILGAFRSDCRITFFEAALLTDPHGILENQGPNTRHADMIRITSDDEVAARQPVIAAYLAEAMRYAEAGIMPPRERRVLELPDELADALRVDPELAAAFEALTPGRQRSYVLNLAAAKTTATRVRRIAAFRERILAGKGATER